MLRLEEDRTLIDQFIPEKHGVYILRKKKSVVITNIIMVAVKHSVSLQLMLLLLEL